MYTWGCDQVPPGEDLPEPCEAAADVAVRLLVAGAHAGALEKCLQVVR